MKRENCLLIIAGPSAVGKTTVAYSMMKSDPRFEFVRSATTRQCRGDKFDAEYIYMSVPEFRTLIANGGVLEHTEYAGNLYGTPRSEVERIIGEGKIPLLVLDINGVTNLVRNADGLSPCGIYVYDSLDVMEKRLYERFLGENPAPDGLKRFVSRKEQNIADYLEIRNTGAAFYTFIHNCGTVSDTADAVAREFLAFTLGEPRRTETVDHVSASLEADARRKVE